MTCHGCVIIVTAQAKNLTSEGPSFRGRGRDLLRLRTKGPWEKKNYSTYVQKDLGRKGLAAPTYKKTSGENHKEACSTNVRKRPREARTRSAYLQKDLRNKINRSPMYKKTSGEKELQRLRTKRPREKKNSSAYVKKKPREETTKRPAAPT